MRARTTLERGLGFQISLQRIPCRCDGRLDAGQRLTRRGGQPAHQRLVFLRQQKAKSTDKPNLCLADFVAPADSGLPDHAGLFGYAYVRYLGDLNGGQVLQRLVQRRFGLAPGQLRFYRFDEIEEPETFIARYRAALDAAVPAQAHARVVAAAQAGFEYNITLSQAVMVAAERR